MRTHVQSGYERPPFSYTNRAAFAFGATEKLTEQGNLADRPVDTVERHHGAFQVKAAGRQIDLPASADVRSGTFARARFELEAEAPGLDSARVAFSVEH